MLAAKIDNLAGHVENESEAFVRVEGFRMEFDRVADKPPLSKSLRRAMHVLHRTS
jgi:hypothetical protein